MDTKIKRTIKHVLSGIALLSVLAFVSFTSNAEFIKIRDRAKDAAELADVNTAQIAAQSEKIAKLEADLKVQQDALVVLKDRQKIQQAQVRPKKVTPPKSYPKPPADFVPLDQQQPKKKKKGWWPFS